MMNNKPFNDLLKEAREEKNIEIEQVFENTYMPVKFIRMIEKGQWEEFPSQAHLKGYLRLYASYLKIDPLITDKYIEEITCPALQEDCRGKKHKDSCGSNFLVLSEKKKLYLLISLFLIFLMIFILAIHILPG